MPRFRALFFALIFASALAAAQETYDSAVYLPNQEIRLQNLPALVATAKGAPAAFAAALEIVLQDPAVCCGRNSALEDPLLSDPQSLRELSAQLQGKHFLNDGRSIQVQADYVPQGSIYPNLLVGPLLAQRPLLVEWKSRCYVIYGAVYDETRHTSGARDYSIHKLYLLDPRFSDARRQVVFNRDTDDAASLGGLLTVTVSQP